MHHTGAGAVARSLNTNKDFVFLSQQRAGAWFSCEQPRSHPYGERTPIALTKEILLVAVVAQKRANPVQIEIRTKRFKMGGGTNQYTFRTARWEKCIPMYKIDEIKGPISEKM